MKVSIGKMYEKEVLRKLGDNFKPLSDNVKLTIRESDTGNIKIAASFDLKVEAITTDLEVERFSDPLTCYEIITRSLLSTIEKSLYKFLPGLNVNPQIALSGSEVKIRIDSHVPEDMVLMSPNTYTKCEKRSQTFLQVLHGKTLGEH